MQADQPQVTDCIFCKIIKRQLPSEVLFENSRAIAILDINPIHYGHALVIPKRHCRDFVSVPEEDLRELIVATQTVARAMVKSLGVEGYNVFANNGHAAGQSIFHFHMHVTPRFPGDDIKFVLKLKSYSGEAMAEYGRRIRGEIPG